MWDQLCHLFQPIYTAPEHTEAVRSQTLSSEHWIVILKFRVHFSNLPFCNVSEKFVCQQQKNYKANTTLCIFSSNGEDERTNIGEVLSHIWKGTRPASRTVFLHLNWQLGTWPNAFIYNEVPKIINNSRPQHLSLHWTTSCHPCMASQEMERSCPVWFV